MNGLIYRSLMNMPYYVWHDPTYPFVIPSINWEVMSHEQRVQWLTCNIAGLIEYVNKQADSLNLLDSDIERLAQEFEKFKESGFNDYYEEQICKWINEKLSCIVSNTVRFVQFGLTDDGRIFVTIPNNWDFLQFKTDMDLDSADFGKLAIVY